MNITSDYSDHHIRTELDYAEITSSTLKSFRSLAKKLVASAEHAASIAVIVLLVSLVILSFARVVESERVTAHYGDAVSHVPLVQ